MPESELKDTELSMRPVGLPGNASRSPLTAFDEAIGV